MKIAIIGGSGKMGRWLASFLKSEGKEVVIADRDGDRLQPTARELGVGAAATNIEAVSGADCVILSVPVENIEEVAGEVGPNLRSRQLVFDVTSVKALPVNMMHR
jgi:prephenate dehydrogenase